MISRILSFRMAAALAACFLFGLPYGAFAQAVPCDELTGLAGPYPCEKVDLLAIVPTWSVSETICNLPDPGLDPDFLVPMTGADIWGWTDEASGREFALQGLSDAVAFVELTDPETPVLLGCLAAPHLNLLWRDVKVYGDHVYIVGDSSPELAPVVLNEDGEWELVPHEHDDKDAHGDGDGHDDNNAGAESHLDPSGFLAQGDPPAGIHGLQIFDLTRLLTADPTPAPIAFTSDAVYLGPNPVTDPLDEAHNLVIDEETGFAAAVASNLCGGEFFMMDLSVDPVNPVFLGCFNSALPGAVHDAQCTIYHGPDTEHQGKQICLAFMEDQFSIFDMSDPGNVQTIASNFAEPGFQYVHQGWFTDDHAYVGSNDELDELMAGPHNTHTYMWDVRDLDNPLFMGTYVGPTASIDHNMYFNGRWLHQANYTAGYRVLDASDIANANLSQVAFFDTLPPDADAPGFAGVWSGYFFFKSGVVALSQINKGELFLLRPRLDTDEDGFEDHVDNCLSTANPTQDDADGDGVGDACDNCLQAENPTQCDSNGDGYGNHCDADLTNNGVINFEDLGMMKTAFFTTDPDADLNCSGVVNFVDLGVMKTTFFGPPGPSALAP